MFKQSGNIRMSVARRHLQRSFLLLVKAPSIPRVPDDQELCDGVALACDGRSDRSDQSWVSSLD